MYAINELLPVWITNNMLLLNNSLANNYHTIIICYVTSADTLYGYYAVGRGTVLSDSCSPPL